MWTAELVELCCERRAAGDTYQKIANEIGLSKPAVIGKLLREGKVVAQPIFWTPERVEFLKQKWPEGHSMGWLARELGTTRASIVGKLHRLKLLKNISRKTIFKLNPARLPTSKPVPVTPHPGFLNIEFANLETGMCKFPLGDGPFFFCGQPAIEGESYCPHCWRVTHGRDNLTRAAA